jgi:hypothetical protein
MLIEHIPEPGLREQVDALAGRLARIDANRIVLCGVADSLGGAHTSPTLADVLDRLERDLTLAAREAGRLHQKAGPS